jgi:P-type Ca2+ transporter type 2B
MSEGAFNFMITTEDLSKLFDHDNIREGKSLELLKTLHGVPGLCEGLLTSQHKGISLNPKEMQERQKAYGKNTPYTRLRDNIFDIIWNALQDTVLQILIAASVISLIIGTMQDPSQGWLEGVAILAAVLIVIIVTSTNDYLKDGQFVKLNTQTNIHNVIVTRSGTEKEIPARDLLVGDLVYISPGEILPVDGILVRGNGITVDESAITGESALMKREIIRAGDMQSNPFLVSGGKVSEGNGMMIVCAVGTNCVLEKQRIMSEQIQEENETPLQERLGIIAAGLGKIGFIAGGLLTTILIIHVSITAIQEKSWGNNEWEEIISSIILGITILVVAIPEGLPLALTLAMAYSIFRMKNENIFVRHIKGCEIMGAATNILSDKTGTLTQNKMKATQFMLYDQDFKENEYYTLSQHKRKLVAEVISRNTTAFVNKVSGKIELVGNRTEGALLEMIESWGFDYHTYRNLDLQKYQFAFNSNSKRMTTVYETESEGLIVYTKGAAESILELCDLYLNSSGDKEKLTHEKRVEIRHKINSYSSKSLRVLGLSYKVACLQSLNEYNFNQETIESKMIFIGFVGISDPIRPEARSSVIKVQQAGVIVRMVTGDKLETAVSIAKQANIIPEGLSPEEIRECVIKGKHFRERVGGLVTIKNDEGKILGFKTGNLDEFKEIIKKIKVLARCSPEDKLLLVTGLKELGEVVGVTGDGSNDAAALKQSDIGLAMMSGTQLAKESSDIILLDDNFESVVNSVKWGRNVYASTRKFLQFQITVNIVALVVSIVGCISVKSSPLSAVQMLWVNLIMDSLAALALATEPPSESLFNTKPYGRSEKMVNSDMHITMCTQALYQITVLLVILYLGPIIFEIEPGWGNSDWSEDNGKHFTIFFHAFVMLQLFNEINCRKIALSEINVFKGFFINWIFIGILIITFCVQFVMIEFGGRPLKCTPLEPKYHILCIGLGALGLVYGIFVRSAVTLYRKKSASKFYPKEIQEIQEEKKSLLYD